MELDVEKMYLSHCLSEHPILNETIEYKIKYLNLLYFFVDKYSHNDIFTTAMFENYKKKFLNKNISKYSYNEKEIKKCAIEIQALRFKKFRLITFRYAFIFDCLLLNSFMNKSKSILVIDDIKAIYKQKYHKNIDYLYKELYNIKRSIKNDMITKYLLECWSNNYSNLCKQKINIIVTATVNAGKSTLINALVGKSINKTMSDVCTSKAHYILDKAFEDNFIYEFDHELNLDASKEILMEDNFLNIDEFIIVSTYFRILGERKSRLCIIDTPGVNSYFNSAHFHTTRKYINEQRFDKLIYVINAENIGTNDDIKHLKFIIENVENNKILFAINKLDKFKSKEDSIMESIKNIKLDLNKLGFTDPIICPVSSYAAVLAKKGIYNEPKSEYEEDEYKYLTRKFRIKEYDLSQYYSEEIQVKAKKIKNANSERFPEEVDLLFKSGMLCFEQLITK